MIDEKKLIEDLIPILNEHGDMYLAGKILGMIDMQPQVVCSRREWYQKGYQDGLNADKWITCEERLPSDRDWYLAVFKEADTDYQLIPMIADYIGTVTNGTTEEGWCIAHCTDTDYLPDEYYKKLKCVAWTFLPQPYKKEGAENE